MSVLYRFYSAFARGDWATMSACYHPEARFGDPVFPDLDAKGVKAMWKMLLNGGSEIRVGFNVFDEHDTGGRVQWDARYNFSSSGRKVHNVVTSVFILQDGLILRQMDQFDFWRWSRQALGTTGLLLGWTPLIRNKVRATAAARLAKAMRNDAHVRVLPSSRP